jgi:preprotein translocase subunit SecA
MRMALIELTPDLKELTKQARRIADALEIIVKSEYGVTMTPTPKPAKDESDVMYATDADQWKREVEDVGHFKNPLRPIDVDEFPDV